MTAFVVEDRAVKFVLVREMPKHHRLGNAGGRAISLVVVPLKPLLRKQINGRLQYLLTALVARHPAVGRI